MCGTVVAPDATTWRCTCGGAFQLSLDVFPPAALDRVTMGEGGTSIATIRIGGREVRAKLEFESPTGSFKDRGAVMLIAAAVDSGATDVVVDSSGNAGVALATYAAHAGLRCEVFVPSTTSLAKVGLISATGAVVRQIKGSREDVASAAAARVDASGAYYASHVWNPWFFEGTKHYVRELFEQLDGRLPGALVLPVGNGTLVLGAARAFQELQTSTRIIAVQAAGCAPIAAAFAAGSDHVAPTTNFGTIAAGIAIAAPVRGDEILAAVRATGGTVLTVSDDELQAAVTELAGQGFAVEPTAAAPAAALAQVTSDDVVIPIASGRRR